MTEKEPSETSSIKQDTKDRKDVVEETDQSSLLESKAKEAKQPSLTEELPTLTKDDKEEVILSSKLGASADGSKEKMTIKQEGQDSGSDIRLHEMPVTEIQEGDQRQESVKSCPELGTELKGTSDIFGDNEPGAKTYFDTSSKDSEEESSQTQSYYELSTAEKTNLSGETTSIRQKTEEQQPKRATVSTVRMSLEQRSLSLNISVGSSTGG